MKEVEDQAWPDALAKGKESQKAFEYAFDEAIAGHVVELIETYGLAPTLHFLSVYQRRVGRIYDFSFLKEHGDIEAPCLCDESAINRIVEDVFFGTSTVENYIIHADDAVLAGNLTGDFRVKVFDDLYATIPKWEASAVIARIRADIEAERNHPFCCTETGEPTSLVELEREYGACDMEDGLTLEELENLKSIPSTEWPAIFGGEKPPDDQLEHFFAH